MPNLIIFKNKIKKFNSVINVSGDKSISIRWILFSSLASGISRAKNLLISEDVIATVKAIEQLGIKTKLKKNSCIIYGKGINGYKYNKNLKPDLKKEIFVPTYEGKESNPVLFSIFMKNQIMNISGDVGAKKIIELNKNKILNVDIKNKNITIDFDTKDSFDSLKGL